jgi:hypothetical protein
MIETIIMLLKIAGVLGIPFIAIFIIDYIYVIKQEYKRGKL